MTDVQSICRLFIDTIELNAIDPVAARKVLLWMGIEFMRNEGFNTHEIWEELEVMREAHKQLNVNS